MSKELVLLGSKYPKDLRQQFDAMVKKLGYTPLPASIGRFKSKEHYCELYPNALGQFEQNKNDIKDSNVHIVMNAENDMDKTFVEAINLAETAKEYGARSVHLVLAFAPYARQDRIFDGRMVSIMGKTFPKHLKCAGVDRITTFDTHSKAAEAFYNSQFGAENVRFLSAVPLIYQAIRQVVAENEKCVFGAPDGGEKPNDTAQARTRELAATDCHQNNMFFITKYHKGMNKTEVIDFKGNVQDCTAIELDDMTDTGGTLVNGAFTLKENGAKRVIAAVTHGIFSGKSLKNLTSDTIGDQENPIDLLLTTDSILGVYGKIRSLNARQKQRIVVIPTLPLIKAALKCT